MLGKKHTHTPQKAVLLLPLFTAALAAAALLSALNLHARASMARLARLTLARKLDAVEILPRRPSPTFTVLRRNPVCAARPEKGGRIPLPITLAPPPPMRRLDINASSMCLNEFTPEFTAGRSTRVTRGCHV